MYQTARDVGSRRVLRLLSPSYRLVWVILVLANSVALFLRWKTGSWMVQTDGSVFPHDYLAQWAAGFRVLEGQAALVYSWPDQVALQTTLIGAAEPVELYIFYPPHFLFTTPVFTWLRPLAAFSAFLACTVALYVAAIRMLVPDWTKAMLVGVAGGGAYCCLLYVQNGFLTAALLVAALALVPSRPRAAGILFGLLTMKPQLGILIPFALAAAGYWRTIGWAAGTFLMFALLAELLLGPGIWAAFVSSTSQTTGFLGAGNLWFKIQSPFALAWPFLGKMGAYLLHFAIAAAVACAVIRLWRNPAVSHRTRSAALIAGSLLMSPYLYPYDAVPLNAAALMLLLNRRLPRPDCVALLAAIVLPGFATTLLAAAVPMAAGTMLVVAMRQAERELEPS